MPNIEKLPNGSFAIERDFEIDVEPWSAYKLLDGGKIRVRTAVLKIYQMVDVDGNPVYDPAGQPVYGAAHKTDVVFSQG